MEGLIFGGVYLRREICVSKSMGLALWLEVNLPFLLVLLCICICNFLCICICNFPSTSPWSLYLEGRFIKGFLRYRIGGLIFGEAYTWRGLFSEFYGNLLPISGAVLSVPSLIST